MADLLDVDQRFSTSNTNLAAAFGALKIPVKLKDPMSRVIDSRNGKEVTAYHFETVGFHFCGEQHKAVQIDWAWRNREKFESDNPNHPLIPIRLSLESRDWLNKVFHGRITPEHVKGSAKFGTEDIFLAAVLRASGTPLHSFNSRRELFRFISCPPQIREEFDNFDAKGRDEGPIALMRRSLEVRKELIAKLDKCPTCTDYIYGDPNSKNFEVIRIPEGLPQEEADLLFDLIK